MANKVGSIMTYSGGTSYDVAGIYDGKITLKRKYQYDITDTADAEFFVHFSPENGIIDECGNDWTINYATNLATISSNNAALDYSIYFQNQSNATFTKTMTFADTDFTIDGWFYYDYVGINTQRAWIFQKGGTNCLCNVRNTGSTREVTFAYAGTIWRTTDVPDVFDDTFHLSHVYTKESINGLRNRIFINGNMVLSNNNVLTPITVTSAQIAGTGSLNNIYCSLFRYSKIARWTDNFIPAESYSNITIPVTGYIPIRHNNQTYYVPLISNANYKQTPCIAVRHNNQTYYTVK